MSPLITGEAVFLLRSVICGMILGIGYEIMGRIVGLLFRRKWWRGLEDLLYWVICALVLFAMICEENGGTIRWYVLVGASAGAGVYYCVVCPILHRILRPLWTLTRKITQFVEKLLKKGEKSVTLINKVKNGALCAKRGRRHGQIR